MKILEYDTKRETVRVIPENIDDLWELYNVIRRGDYIYARSSREIKIEEETARPTNGKRIILPLGLHVEKTSFQKYNDRLRAHGVIVDAPEKFGLMGCHHTVNIALGKPLMILKKEWHSYDIERLERASKERGNPLIIVSMDDENACVALIRQHGIDVKVEIAARLPGKLESEKNRKAALARYFHSILKELVLTWKENHSLIAVIGPGFLKESFTKYVKEKQPHIFKNISAIRTVGNGGAAGVEEALRSGVLNVVIKKMRIIEETQVVEEFLSRLASQSNGVSYGLENVKKAISYGAVASLLIADALLREADDKQRNDIENFIRDVERMRGKIMMVSTDHEAGKKLLNLGGVAALLRFPIDKPCYT